MAEPDFPEDWTDERRRAFREGLRARQARQVRAGQGFGLALGVIVAAGVLLRLPEAWWVPAVGAVALGGLVFRMVNLEVPVVRGAASDAPGPAVPGVRGAARRLKERGRQR